MKIFLLTTALITVVPVNCRVNANPAESRSPTENKRKASPKSSKANGLGPSITDGEIAAAMANSNLMKPHTGEDQFRENSGKFEGDVILTPQQQAQMGISGRSAVKDVNLLWDDGIIPYTISSVFTTYERQVIARAIGEYHERTCLKFVGRTTETDYIEIISGGGCWSNVGRVGGRQYLSLMKNGCVYVGTAIHEFMHASGFWHEQSRYDRDNYVTINWENIWDSASIRRNFNKQTWSNTAYLGLQYDYKSVMHYSATAFSKNGKPTITPKKAGETIGHIEGFSQLDVSGLNLLYKCEGTMQRSILEWHFVVEDYFVRFNERMSWIDAEKFCGEFGLELYHPKNPMNVAKYLADNFKSTGSFSYGSFNYHVGARGNGTHMVWLSGEVVDKNDLQEKWDHNVVGSNDCLIITTYPYHINNRRYMRAGPHYCNTIGNLGYPLCGDSQSYSLTWHSVGEEKFARYNHRMDWQDSRTLCQQFGLDLYQAKEVFSVAEYLSGISFFYATDLDTYYWLGANRNGKDICWLSGEVIPRTSSLWWSRYPNYGCVYMVPHPRNGRAISTTHCNSKAAFPLCG